METLTYRRQKVYDPILRIIHAWNGFAILLLILTVSLADFTEKGAGENLVWQLHIYLGYALILGLVARLVWGIVGPAHARISDMWHPAAWWNAIRQFSFRSTPRFGHDRLASGVYLAVYGLLVVMAFTGLGLAAAEHSVGPLNAWFGDMAWEKDLFEEPHEFIYGLLIGFVVLHIAALIWHEWKDKTPLAQGMVSGYKYQLESEKENDHA
ncbi:MAG: cytochrome b/b6 domain-containing protein [Methylophilales bacterium]|nr:cytochrome b/b6 domain-containing protein [Methylophilales bacterium]